MQALKSGLLTALAAPSPSATADGASAAGAAASRTVSTVAADANDVTDAASGVLAGAGCGMSDQSAAGLLLQGHHIDLQRPPSRVPVQISAPAPPPSRSPRPPHAAAAGADPAPPPPTSGTATSVSRLSIVERAAAALDGCVSDADRRVGSQAAQSCMPMDVLDRIHVAPSTCPLSAVQTCRVRYMQFIG